MKKTNWPLIILIILVILSTAVLSFVFWPFIRNLGDQAYREAFSEWVKGLGIRGIAVLFGLQVLQVLVAVIPGGPMELIAGAAYGAWGGLAVCAAGSVFASTLIYLVVKKFGLPLVYRFFDEEKIRSWKFFADTEKTARAIFIIFLIPGTPKDMLTWIGPLSGLSPRRFVILSNLGRLPAILCTAIMGDSVIQGNWALFAGIFAATALAGLLGFRFKRRVIGFLQKRQNREERQDGPG
jgi:uncharacterized membrane protein YdjX (TVP38/TMEM64 family)